jgi:hypothetical protein
MKVRSTSPNPKKTESTIPSAASYLTRVVRTTPITIKVPRNPASAAPVTRTRGALLPVSRKAIATPGSAACEIASPSRLWRRSTAKVPSAPLVIPSAAEPSATVRSV